MKKIITIEPFQYGFKDLFKKLNENLFGLAKNNRWNEYQEYCGISSVDYYLKYLDLTNLYDGVDERIELWKISGKEIGLKGNVSYDELLQILSKYKFSTAPRGTAFWIPIGLKRQEKILEEKLKIVSDPINNNESESYKTMGLSLNGNKSGLEIKCFELRRVETLFGLEDRFVVQRIN